MEYLVVTMRVITIMILALIVTLIAGRRKMGELPIFDFIVIITLGAVIGADIADPEIQHLPTAYAVILLVGIQYVYSVVIMKNKKIGHMLTFEPVIVIENGQFVKANLKKIKYSIDNVLMMLREKNVFDVNEVEFAVVESTGQISVLKKSQYQPITAKEIKVNTEYKGLSIPLIVEGEVYEENLSQLKLDVDWLVTKLKEKNIDSLESVFFASINTEGQLYISTGLGDTKDIHNLRH
ncbi:uncharacterized membrane protein YcaP (DUF421 family) [Anaerobacterium chartisolvens]|uniref:Uncharacterized membrane protein YcaP (DUF421 family) n=1 Tax=Anaerobacterium chartisolvens TaxID=1297424 RepID=A0A369B9B4_9FIRM|nr:DUF421 domain-containing protein [Anaerobacterium chartisolvens]RCX17117.1 uncharacterized membrane protein YcaP (DUF421 family) [Anaerobacterium chartisolvens]